MTDPKRRSDPPSASTIRSWLGIVAAVIACTGSLSAAAGTYWVRGAELDRQGVDVASLKDGRELDREKTIRLEARLEALGERVASDRAQIDGRLTRIESSLTAIDSVLRERLPPPRGRR